MKTVNVDASKKYQVHIGEGLLNSCGNIISSVIPACTAAVITDDIVDALYFEAVKKSLSESGFRVVKKVFRNGENSKNLSVYADILKFLAESGVTRSDTVIALGGGVTGDMAGFAATTYLRGVRFLQLPTTLLAMLDSSVGGKTGVNLEAGKNLVGAFYQPELVICDTNVLSTLDENTFSCGIAEAVKYGMIADGKLLSRLTEPDIKENLDSVIHRCVEIKAETVKCDEFDNGKRQILNFGHTVGHAVEKCSGYTVPHGHAVSIGMVYVTKAAMKRGLCEEDCLTPLLKALRKYSLPVGCTYTAEELTGKAMSDKKRKGGSVTLVIPKKPGECRLFNIDTESLTDFIRDGEGI